MPAIYSGVAFALSGSSVVIAPNAVITVRREDTGALASLFSDRAGSVGLTNPLTADVFGRFSFFAAGLAQGYRITVTEAGSPGTEYTLRYQAVGTAAEFDATAYAATLLAAAAAAAARTVLGSGATGDALFLTTTAVAALSVLGLPTAALGFPLVNGALGTPTVSNGTLTVPIKTLAGADPSGTDPVYVVFRNVTAESGAPTILTLTTATSLAISNGSTLGVSSGAAFRFWIVGFNDGGTFRMAAINCLSGTSIYPLAGWGIASAVAEGGSPGDADSAHVFYASQAISSKAYAVLGYVEYGERSGSPTEFGLPVAGVYSSAPTRVQVFSQGVPLPGHMVQLQRTPTGASTTGTTTIPADDTIPQNTEGDQYMTQAITPQSSANLLMVEAQGEFSHSVSGHIFGMALFKDSVASALAATQQWMDSAGVPQTVSTICHWLLAGTTSPTTFKVRAGGASGGTTTFNGNSGARSYGGVLNSYMQIREFMT